MRTALLLLVALPLFAACCMSPRSRCCDIRAAEPTAPLAPGPEVADGLADAQGRLYDADGRALDRVPARALIDADLVAFGELHGHPLGAAMELRLLEYLAATDRPVALAMEFLERDVQETVDDYLAGRIDEPTFLKQARQGAAYAATHRPLIEFCKAQGIPVIAANSPRRLVRAWRKAGTTDYDAWLATLSEADRGDLPRSTSRPEDAYRERFMKLMGPRGENFFLSQALWDDAMGEAVADFRDQHPRHRVLLVVGAFHVQKRLGTITKFLDRRPRDRVAVMKMTPVKAEELAFAADDAGEAQLLYKVTMPPKKQKAPSGPNPHATQPKPKAKDVGTAPMP